VGTKSRTIIPAEQLKRQCQKQCLAQRSQKIHFLTLIGKDDDILSLFQTLDLLAENRVLELCLQTILKLSGAAVAAHGILSAKFCPDIPAVSRRLDQDPCLNLHFPDALFQAFQNQRGFPPKLPALIPNLRKQNLHGMLPPEKVESLW
jgi:hypothetical protein